MSEVQILSPRPIFTTTSGAIAFSSFPSISVLVTVPSDLLTRGLAGAAFADFSGPVVGVLDGDTIEVLHNTHPEFIRLSGIDCPEKFLRRTGRPHVEPMIEHTMLRDEGRNIVFHVFLQ